MQPALAFALLLMSTSACFAQDAELRDRAVALLERAHAVSIPPNLPNLERVDTFSVFNPDAQAREGSFSRVVIQGTGRREEITFGNYHVTHIWTGNARHFGRDNHADSARSGYRNAPHAHFVAALRRFRRDSRDRRSLAVRFIVSSSTPSGDHRLRI